ncbi:MAG: hypothetical protein HGA45_15690 [Chloroflexales bacterium]|nr:hypothetical protein [Chloroflexales bacterium]
MGRKVSVTRQSDTDRNTGFKVNTTGERLSRAEFVRAIEQGRFPDYHVRVINGVKTPVSNPDSSETNNLG